MVYHRPHHLPAVARGSLKPLYQSTSQWEKDIYEEHSQAQTWQSGNGVRSFSSNVKSFAAGSHRLPEMALPEMVIVPCQKNSENAPPPHYLTELST